MLDLERIVWPSSSSQSGGDFDILARKNLWAVGLDYKHGTGHGVGHFLCVHESPPNTGKALKTKMEVGMCMSDEPGFY